MLAKYDRVSMIWRVWFLWTTLVSLISGYRLVDQALNYYGYVKLLDVVIFLCNFVGSIYTCYVIRERAIGRARIEELDEKERAG